MQRGPLLLHVVSITSSSQTYYRGKRDTCDIDLSSCTWSMQKKPTIGGKETYYQGKRDLSSCMWSTRRMELRASPVSLKS